MVWRCVYGCVGVCGYAGVCMGVRVCVWVWYGILIVVISGGRFRCALSSLGTFYHLIQVVDKVTSRQCKQNHS